MALSFTVDTFKKYAPELSGGVRIDSLASKVASALRDNIYPVLGKTYTDEATSYLKDLIEESVVSFVTHALITTHTVTFTGSGVQRMETEQFRPLFKYQEQNYRDLTLTSAYNALEAAIAFSLTTSWRNTAEGKKASQRLLNLRREAESFVFDYTTFRAILPLVKLVEDEALRPMLTATLYNTLRNVQYTNLNELQTELLTLIRDALSAYAVELAIRTNIVTVIGNVVRVVGYEEDDASQHSYAPRADLMRVALETQREFVPRFFRRINNFLTENATALNWTPPTVSEAVTDEESTAQTGIISI